MQAHHAWSARTTIFWAPTGLTAAFTQVRSRAQLGTSKSLERPAVADPSTSTEMPPDQLRHSFGHPQVWVSPMKSMSPL